MDSTTKAMQRGFRLGSDRENPLQGRIDSLERLDIERSAKLVPV